MFLQPNFFGAPKSKFSTCFGDALGAGFSEVVDSMTGNFATGIFSCDKFLFILNFLSAANSLDSLT